MSNRPVPAAGVISRELHGQLVLISPTSGKIRVLNATGAAIWQALQAGQDSRTIAAELAERFAIPAETAHRDVAAFIEDLLQRGLLHPPTS